jgi:hypothetical protein
MQTRYTLIAGIAAAFALMQNAGAISIDFSQPTIDLTGGPVTEDITVSGLTAAGQAITGYDLWINFDSTALSVGTVNQPTTPFYDPTDPTQFAPIINPINFPTANTLEIGLEDFNGDADAQALQGDSVLLAQVTFAPLGGGTGTSTVSFDLADSQVVGLNDSLLTFSSATSVPEPSPLALGSLGLIGLFFAMRFRRRPDLNQA